MKFRDQFICVSDDNREGPDPLSLRSGLPILPNSAQSERIAVTHSDGRWLLRLALDGLPLEEAVSRHNASPKATAIYNPNPWMTFGGMGSKKLIGENIEYIANYDCIRGRSLTQSFVAW